MHQFISRNAITAYAAGVLCANSLPHLVTAVAGERLMTPFAGRGSSRFANLLWGGTNLTAGLVLAARNHEARCWTGHLATFGAGAASFSAWSVVAEKVFKFNS